MKKYQIHPTKDGQWFVKVVAANGETTFAGEPIQDRGHAIATAENEADPGCMIQVFNSDDNLERDYPVSRRGKA